MNTISEITKQIITLDVIHLETLLDGTLNLRAYANTVKAEVEKKAKKMTSIESIVIALSRLRSSNYKENKLIPEVTIQTLSIKADLSVITYEKTKGVINTVTSMYTLQKDTNEFYVVSEGLAEVTIASSTELINNIDTTVKEMYKKRFDNAVAITISFDEKYIEIPNVLYSFVSTLALKKVNLLQVVSNLTEVSFIIDEKYMSNTIDIFKKYLHK